jgi:hypothetical protein
VSKSFISISISTSSLLVRVDLPTVNGSRLVAVGKWGPAFEQPKCADCRDFQRVTVRRAGRLAVVTCPQCVSTGTGNDMPARIPTGSPQPDAVLAVSA